MRIETRDYATATDTKRRLLPGEYLVLLVRGKPNEDDSPVHAEIELDDFLYNTDAYEVILHGIAKETL